MITWVKLMQTHSTLSELSDDVPDDHILGCMRAAQRQVEAVMDELYPDVYKIWVKNVAMELDSNDSRVR